MDLEQTVKDLQAHNSQFQQLLMTLAKGQEDLKALLEKDKDKKKKRPGVVIMGRRFKSNARKVLEFPSTSDEGVGKGKGTAMPSESEVEEEEEEEEEEDEDYSEQQYPPTNDKFKNLEDRLAAMELQRVLGLDFEELGLVDGIVIPPKFKVPTFSKYDGLSCPKMHLRSYVRKIQPHSSDKDLWFHFFQDSLSGTQLDWFYQRLKIGGP